DRGAAADGLEGRLPRQRSQRIEGSAPELAAGLQRLQRRAVQRGRFRGTIISVEVHWGGRDGHVCLLTDVPIATPVPIRDWRNRYGFSRASDRPHDARVAVATLAVKKRCIPDRSPIPGFASPGPRGAKSGNPLP